VLYKQWLLIPQCHKSHASNLRRQMTNISINLALLCVYIYIYIYNTSIYPFPNGFKFKYFTAKDRIIIQSAVAIKHYAQDEIS
jgi:hypothetical protein